MLLRGKKWLDCIKFSVEIPETSEDEEFLQSFTYSHLDSMDTQRLEAFLLANRDLFAMNTSEMGCTNVVTHKIELDDETPFQREIQAYTTRLISGGASTYC